jgi:uncharacterized protein (TIGR02271 family)
MENKSPLTAPSEGPVQQSSSHAEQSGGKDSSVLQLFAEDAEVSRQTVETGRVRISKTTHTRNHLIDELLARTNVEVKTIPIGRVIEAIPPVQDDGNLMIIPIVEETLVVERRLVLKEELHIRRVHTTERYQETVKLRHQTSQITRLPARRPTAGDEAAVGSITGPNPDIPPNEEDI